MEKLFFYKYIKYLSNYFIKKLRNVKHWYMDGTWIYTKEFKKLIIMSYYYEIGKKRFPWLYALINNKTLEGNLNYLKKSKP